jgi:hypothetical protein
MAYSSCGRARRDAGLLQCVSATAMLAYGLAMAVGGAQAAELNLNGTNTTLPQTGFFGNQSFVNGADTVTNNGTTAATLTEGGGASGTVFSGTFADGATASTGWTHTSGEVTITGVNTHTGGTTVQGGAVIVSPTGTLGGNANALTVASGGTVDLGGTTQTQNGGLSLTGGTVRNGTLSSTGTFSLQAGTVSASLAGTGAVSKTTGGTVTLSGANTYSGGTSVSAGTLQISGAGTLGATTGTTAVSGGTLDLGGTTQDQNALNQSGGTVQNGQMNVGTYVLTGGILAANATVSATSQYVVTEGTVNGVLTGAANLIKDGAGTVMLAGANSYGGTTAVNAGTLALTSTGSITSNVSVIGGTLSNAGVIAGGVSIAAGGTATNSGSITLGVLNAGTFSQTAGSVTGGVNNTGTVNATGGAINGAIANNAGQFNVGGTVTSDSTFDNAVGASLNVQAGGSYTVAGLLSNQGTTIIAANGTLNADGGITNAGSFTNSGTVTTATRLVNTNGFVNSVNATLNGGLDTSNFASNEGTINGGVTNSANFTNNNTVNGGLTNTAGITHNFGTINGGVNVTGGELSTSGTVNGGLTNSGTVNARGGAVNGVIDNNAGGQFNVDPGASGTVASGSAFNNASGANLAIQTGTYTLAGRLTNEGATMVDVGAAFNANGGISSSGTFSNFGTVTTASPLANSGLFLNNAGAVLIGGLNNSGIANSAGTINGGVTNSGNVTARAGAVNGVIDNNRGGVFNVTGSVTSDSAFNNNAGAFLSILAGNYTLGGLLTNGGGVTLAGGAVFNADGGISSSGDFTNFGTVATASALVNSGAFANMAGGILNGGLNNSGLTNTAGTINGGVTNTGTVNATAGAINGAINNNSGGQFIVAGSVTSDASFNNSVNATLAVDSGSYSITGVLDNSGAVNVNGTSLLQAGGVVNRAGGSIAVAVGATLIDALDNSGSVVNAGTYVADVINRSGGTILNTGSWIGDANNLAGGTITTSGTWTTNTGAFINAGVLNATGTITGNLANSGTVNVPGTAPGGTSLNLVGNLTNTGTLSMQNGVVTNQVSVTGSSTHNGTVAVDIRLDQNSASQRADVLSVAGSSTGTTIVNFNNIGGNGVLFATPIPVITSGTGGALSATAVNLPASNGIVGYSLQQVSPGNFSVVATPCVQCITAPLTSILAAVASLDASFHQPASALVASAQGVDPNKWTGGVWSRVSGGQNQVQSTGSDVFAGVTSTTALQTQTIFRGIQAGIDTGALNIAGSGWNGHFGITGGEVTATAAAQQVQQTTFFPSTIDFKVPFLGLYGVVTNGTFFADFTVRHDFYSLDVTSPVAGLNKTAVGGHSNSASASLGYHTAFGSFVVEPSIGLSYTQSEFDNIVVNGNSLLQFDQVKSLLGRASLRLADTLKPMDRLVLQPFVVGTVWHEFAGDSTGRYVNDFAATTAAVVPVAVDRVGTFGQVGVGISGQLIDTGFLGFVRGDVRFGEKINGFGVVGGARYTFN